MQKRLFLLFSFFAFLFTGQADKAGFGVRAQAPVVSLLTGDPGAPLYTAFGHSAVRVRRPWYGEDYTYNYGVFDFDTPNFYGKFVRGQLDYMVSVTSTSRFLYEYQYDSRQVYEQVLQLTPEEASAVAKHLEWKALPANRLYRYDFFFDNCATRIRDILDSTLQERLRWPPDTLSTTFRKLLQPPMQGRDWGLTGFNLILGIPSNARADRDGQMFLPMYLMEYLQGASVNRNGEWVPLASKPEILLEGDPYTPPPVYFKPWMLYALFLLLGLLFILFRKRRLGRLLLYILCIVAAASGILFIFMWFFTDHEVTWQNPHLLWLHPIWLLWPWATRRKIRWVLGSVLGLGVLGYWGWLALQPSIGEWEYWPWQLAMLFCVIGGMMHRRRRVDTKAEEVDKET